MYTPLYNVISVSYTHLDVYKRQGYGNTIVYTVLGTCISVVLNAFAAYPLSRKDFYGRNMFMGVFVFTMFFTLSLIHI